MGYKRIKELKEYNLLEEERDDDDVQGRVAQYRTTPKGREYVELYNKLSELYPNASTKEEIDEDLPY
jgi:chromosome segregation and condensation protein ScpB